MKLLHQDLLLLDLSSFSHADNVLANENIL